MLKNQDMPWQKKNEVHPLTTKFWVRPYMGTSTTKGT